MITRRSIAAVGVLIGLYGGYLLLALGGANLLATGKWLVGGVVLHDAVLAPLLVVVGIVVVATVPARVRGPVTAGLVVLGTVTMTAIPVLGRFGARPDNLTLLDRHYVWGWVVFAALVAAGTTVAALRRTPHSPGETEED